MLAWRCPNPRRTRNIVFRKDDKGRADAGLAQHEHHYSGDAPQLECSDRRSRRRHCRCKKRAASNHDLSILYCIVWILYIDLPSYQVRCYCPAFSFRFGCLMDGRWWRPQDPRIQLLASQRTGTTQRTVPYNNIFRRDNQ